MAEPLDILDQRDPVGGPIVLSVLIHSALAASLFLGWYWMNRSRETLGDVHPAGGPAYAVSAVDKIPIPASDAPPNPVAADTKSQVPTAPAKQEAEKKPPEPDKNAFEIPDRRKPPAPQPLHQQQYMQPAPPNQVYSHTRTAVSSPMYAQSGAGQVGIGPDSPLGSRLGWYAEIVRQRIAQQWVTNGLDARTQQGPAIVSFVILRNGTVQNVRVIQTSGNPNIDATAQRAVYQANPLPALPPQITESYISAQFTFNLR
jgi:periplasmic protein TonB